MAERYSGGVEVKGSNPFILTNMTTHGKPWVVFPYNDQPFYSAPCSHHDLIGVVFVTEFSSVIQWVQVKEVIMIIQPVGAPRGRKDVSCCWFALGSLWELLEGYDDEDGVVITTNCDMSDYGPRGGHGDFSSVGTTMVTAPDFPISPQNLDEGEWKVNGMNLVRGDESIEVSDGSMVKLIAYTGLKAGNESFSIGEGSFPVGEYREALLMERKWWMNTLNIEDVES